MKLTEEIITTRLFIGEDLIVHCNNGVELTELQMFVYKINGEQEI